MGMGGKGGGGGQRVADYYLSIHLGICAGTPDALTGLYYNERSFWSGDLAGTGAISINLPDLFGGKEKEGGLVGMAYYLNGEPSQVLPEGLANRLGLTASDCPAFRDIATVFFYGGSGGGFLWSTNNPYVQGIWATVRRIPKSLNAAYARIGNDANGAHIIYECLTDANWGMGASPSIIDVDSFNSASIALYTEGFGLSMIWAKQSTIEDFISEVLDHISATLFQHPRTGLLTLKLLRGDYDVSTLRVLNPDNCVVNSFSRKLLGDTTNEICVTWTDPVNEQEATVTVQNIANIASQGSVVSDSRNYYGIRSADLATRIGYRDLRSASYPLANAEIAADRSFWDVVPGEVVVLNYPEYDIQAMPMRVTNVDCGRPGSPAVILTVVEDVYALESSVYTQAPGSAWVDPSERPSMMSHWRLFTLPYYFVRRLSVSTSDDRYPEVGVGVFGAQSGSDTWAYNLLAEETLPTGSKAMVLVGRYPTAGWSTLNGPIAAEASTLIPAFGSMLGGTRPTVGGFVWIGSDPATMEIALIKWGDAAGWTLYRGMLDTVPRAWPTGTQVWFTETSTPFADLKPRAGLTSQPYKMLSISSRGILAEADAPVITANLTDRPYLPFRPANVKINGTSFQAVNIATADTTITVTWSNRNRILEDAQVLAWTDGTVAPETDQTTRIDIVSSGGGLIMRYTGLTGTSYSIPRTALGSFTQGSIRVMSERNGHVSHQFYEAPFTVT